jgi:hypothetical protein
VVEDDYLRVVLAHGRDDLLELAGAACRPHVGRMENAT